MTSKIPYLIAIYPFGSWKLFVFMVLTSFLFQSFVVYPIFHNRIATSKQLNDTLDMMLIKAVVDNGIGTKEDVYNRLLQWGQTEYKDYL